MEWITTLYKVDNFLIYQLEHGAKFADPPPLGFHWRSSLVIFRTMITISILILTIIVITIIIPGILTITHKEHTYKSSFMCIDDNFKQWRPKLIKKGIYSRSLSEAPATFTLKSDSEETTYC